MFCMTGLPRSTQLAFRTISALIVPERFAFEHLLFGLRRRSFEDACRSRARLRWRKNFLCASGETGNIERCSLTP